MNRTAEQKQKKEKESKTKGKVGGAMMKVWSPGHNASDVHVAAGTRENGARACGRSAERAYVAASSAPLTCDRVSADGLHVWHVLMHATRRDLGVYVNTPGVVGTFCVAISRLRSR